MAFLVAGIVLWIGIHLVPSLGLAFKQRLVSNIGLLSYRVIFAGCILTALALIIIGWRNAQPVSIYLPVYELRPVVIGIVVLAFVLLGATGRATRIGRLIRFPQLVAVLLWAGAHLLGNGDSRSLVLFSGMAIWAALMMFLISRREGTWEKKPVPSWIVEISGIVLSLLLAGLAFRFHAWFTGMPIY